MQIREVLPVAGLAAWLAQYPADALDALARRAGRRDDDAQIGLGHVKALD